MSSYMMKQCAICRCSLNSGGMDCITATCDHTFHRNCAETEIKKKKDINCPTCGIGRFSNNVPSNNNVMMDQKRNSTFSTSGATSSHANAQRGENTPSKNQDEHPFRKERSFVDASSSEIRKHGDNDYDHTSPSNIDHEDNYSPKIGWRQISKSSNEDSNRHGHLFETKKQFDANLYNSDSHKTTSSSSKMDRLAQSNNTAVYISDLPVNIKDPYQLENAVRLHIKSTYNIELDNIQCYAEFGFGIMHVLNDQIRNLLLNDDRQLKIDLNGKQVKISLTDTLELVSYIVLDITKENKNISLPTAQEISIELIKYQMSEKLLSCDQLNAQFLNIYQFICTPSDQLLHTDIKKKIYINGISARIYYCADCNFFENLPKSITQQDLKEAIERDIEQGNISSSSLHIQLNEQTRDACVIVTDKARKWVTKTHLNLHGKSILKKNGLICRLLLYPVPQTYNMQQIFNHEIFHGKVINYKHNDQTLTIELSDKKTFHECLKFGILKVNGDIFHIKTSSESTNSEDNEINAATWYKAEMVQYKPDIMQFVVTPEHIIFHYRWNARVWLDEFERSPTHPRDSKATKTDNIRHLLRMTVMLNTIAAIRKKSYILDGQEVKL
ncbi:unnamed protein product, partial [Adineta steineri]